MSYTQLSTTERFKLYQYRTTDQLTLEEVKQGLEQYPVSNNYRDE